MRAASVLNLPAEDWTALAAWFTVIAAFIAGGVASRQVREARTLRLAQAQPYVIAYLQEGRNSAQIVELVVRNLGTTAATEVVVSIDPPPFRTLGDAGTPLKLPDSFGVLVPGQEWRTIWDSLIQRKSVGLPDRYTATVSFVHRGGRESYEFPLDWGPFWGRTYVVTHDVHDAVTALQKIETAVLKIANRRERLRATNGGTRSVCDRSRGTA